MVKCAVFVNADLKTGHVSYPGIGNKKSVWWRFVIKRDENGIPLLHLNEVIPVKPLTFNLDLPVILSKIEEHMRQALMFSLAEDADVEPLVFEISLKDCNPHSS